MVPRALFDVVGDSCVRVNCWNVADEACSRKVHPWIGEDEVSTRAETRVRKVFEVISASRSGRSWSIRGM